MQPKRQPIKLTIPLDLLCNVWTSRTNLNQSIDNRIEELLAKGLETQQANAQLDELIKDGKIKAPLGANKK